jgi:hypothetical protein
MVIDIEKYEAPIKEIFYRIWNNMAACKISYLAFSYLMNHWRQEYKIWYEEDYGHFFKNVLFYMWILANMATARTF